ncbi:MAG: hypothetical protein IPL52_11590 [Flavobacteriales bacterium]|nr:hypothetical protein [Flavobacteriales bacterium]
MAQPGEYWATVNELGCTATDTVQVIEVAFPQVVLDADTANCSGQAIMLAPLVASGGTLQWSTGISAPTIAVDISGTYALAIANGCATASDTVVVSINGPVVVDLGSDTTICGAIQLTLFSASLPRIPAWSTGAQDAQVMVTSPGAYWVAVDVTAAWHRIPLLSVNPRSRWSA